jgi:tetratricopeptide (TPR) repeat protein
MPNLQYPGRSSSGSSDGTDSPGLGPMLDLLGKMERQVGSIAHARPEQAAASSAADEELRSLREELLAADQRGYEQLGSFTQALGDLKLAIPSLIEEAVNSRFLEIEDAFHRNVKEIHSRSIDAFTQSVQSKIGQRIAALEMNLSIHTEAMGQLREHYLKTDRNVQRLMSGLDRLTAEMMRLSSGASAGNVPRTVYMPGPSRPERTERGERQERVERYDPRPLSPSTPQDPPTAHRDSESDPAPYSKESPPRRLKKRKSRRSALILVPVLALLVLGLVGLSIRAGGGLSASTASEAKGPDAHLRGVAAQMRMAADFSAEKDYAKAESTYRLVLKSEPKNREAVKELASVLFRQQRYEEAAAVLKTLPPE